MDICRSTGNTDLAAILIAVWEDEQLEHNGSPGGITFALLLSSYLAAGKGIDLPAWLKSVGGTCPEIEIISSRRLFPPQWYQPVDVVQPRTLGDLDPATIVTRKQLAELLDVSERTIDRRIKAHELPEPHKRGRESYWLAGELQQEVEP